MHRLKKILVLKSKLGGDSLDVQTVPSMRLFMISFTLQCCEGSMHSVETVLGILNFSWLKGTW